MGLTGGLALALDWLLFARLRAKGQAIIVVMASFGASMALRSLLEFLFTSSPDLLLARDPDGAADRAWHPHHARSGGAAGR